MTMRPPRGPNYANVPVDHPGNPRPTVSSLEVGDKRVDCEHYDRCLALGAKRNWPSWTCSACEGYEESVTFPRAGTRRTCGLQLAES
jgi:hypothetical protein